MYSNLNQGQERSNREESRTHHLMSSPTTTNNKDVTLETDPFRDPETRNEENEGRPKVVETRAKTSSPRIEKEPSIDFREKLCKFENLSLSQMDTRRPASGSHQNPDMTKPYMKGRRVYSLSAQMPHSIHQDQKGPNWSGLQYARTIGKDSETLSRDPPNEDDDLDQDAISTSGTSETDECDHANDDSDEEDDDTTSESGHELGLEKPEQQDSNRKPYKEPHTSTREEIDSVDTEKVLAPSKPPRMFNRRTVSEQFTGRGNYEQPVFHPPPSSTFTNVPSSLSGSKELTMTGPPRRIYPETLNVNRRPPFLSGRAEIKNRVASGCVFLSKNYVCVGGNELKIWSVATGELSRTVVFVDPLRVISGSFLPSEANNPRDSDLWIGLSDGRICLVNVHLGRIVEERTNVHTFGVRFMIGYKHGIISISSEGCVNIWEMQQGSIPSLRSQPRSFMLAQRPSIAIVVRDMLWTASPKGLNVYDISTRTLSNSTVTESGTASITGFAILRQSTNDYAVLLHMDGTITVYDTSTFEKRVTIHVTDEKINCIQTVGEQHIWLGLETGEILVLDAQDNWCVAKQWRAHQTSIVSLDLSCELHSLILASTSNHGTIRLWNGNLSRDYIEKEVRRRESEYSVYQDFSVFIGSWNVNAQGPHLIPDEAIRSWFNFKENPDIIVIGLQEIVDLESKKITAKSIFRSSDNPGALNSRGWQQKLISVLKSLGRGTLSSGQPTDSYDLIQCNYLVGIFTGIFVRSSLLKRLQHLDMAMVKTGLHGLHGNKGGIAMRVTIDDSSICFVNCHLAAGQSQTAARNADVASVINSASLRHPVTIAEGITFINGGDGTMIQDHEFCVFFGDLNYRIDMPSHSIRRKIDERDYNGLYFHDQLRCTKPRTLLRNFREGSLHFAPTYKFDVGTDIYDTSDKMRPPAWCDRILWRGEGGKVILHNYQRHELRYSDHRPISALMTLRIKKIDRRTCDAIRVETTKLWDSYERARLDRMKQW